MGILGTFIPPVAAPLIPQSADRSHPAQYSVLPCLRVPVRLENIEPAFEADDGLALEVALIHAVAHRIVLAATIGTGRNCDSRFEDGWVNLHAEPALRNVPGADTGRMPMNSE